MNHHADTRHVQAALRAHTIADPVYFGPLTLDPVRRWLTRQGYLPQLLKPAEAVLMATAMLAPRGILRDAAAYDALYWDRGDAGEPDPQVITVFISKMRGRLKGAGFEIVRIRSVGWELRDLAGGAA